MTLHGLSTGRPNSAVVAMRVFRAATPRGPSALIVGAGPHRSATPAPAARMTPAPAASMSARMMGSATGSTPERSGFARLEREAWCDRNVAGAYARRWEKLAAQSVLPLLDVLQLKPECGVHGQPRLLDLCTG